MPRFDQLVLPFGLGIAAVTLVYWAALGYARHGELAAEFTGEGVFRAAFAMGAVGVLALVLRLGHWVCERGRDAS